VWVGVIQECGVRSLIECRVKGIYDMSKNTDYRMTLFLLCLHEYMRKASSTSIVATRKCLPRILPSQLFSGQEISSLQ